LVDVTSVLAPTATLSLTANMSFTRSKKILGDTIYK